MSDKYILFALPNGAEVIGQLEHEQDEWIKVAHPLVIRPIPQGPNQFMIDLFPYSLSNSDGKHLFTKSQILSRSTQVPDGLIKAYMERTSNLIIAGAVDAFEKLGK